MKYLLCASLKLQPEGTGVNNREEGLTFPQLTACRDVHVCSSIWERLGLGEN